MAAAASSLQRTLTVVLGERPDEEGGPEKRRRLQATTSWIDAAEHARLDRIHYARKGRTVEEKLRLQMQRALQDPCSRQTRVPAEAAAALQPVDEKTILVRRATCLFYSPESAQHQGSRPYQEDRLIEQEPVLFTHKGERLKAYVYGVFDGHGDEGKSADHVRTKLARYLGCILTERLVGEETISAAAITDSLCRVCDCLSRSRQHQIEQTKGQRGGTTASFALRIGSEIFVANVGDARTFFVKKEATLPVSADASLEKEEFRKAYRGNFVGRAKDHSLRVCSDRASRISLGVARAIGGHPWMCCRPKITRIEISPKEDDLEEAKIYCQPGDLCVFVTDGVTGWMTTDVIGEWVRRGRARGESLRQIAMRLVEMTGRLKGSDNCTVLIVPIRDEI